MSYLDFGVFLDCAQLTSVYFDGDAPPRFRSVVFRGSPFVVIFHRAEATGWRSTFDFRPTAVWIPQPAYEDWVVSTGLATQYPNASAANDDPDGDGLTNGAEWMARTDPTQRGSRLELELTPRRGDLSEPDLTRITPSEYPVYFRTVPGQYYGVESASNVSGPWTLRATSVATTTQKRFVLPRFSNHDFFRVRVLP